jgi:hypothetical protein
MKVRRRFVDFIIPVEGDSFAGGIQNDLAVMARGSMGTNLFEEFRANLPIEVVGKLAEKICASHAGRPSFF